MTNCEDCVYYEYDPEAVAPLSHWPKLRGKPSRSGGDAGMKWDRPAYLILSKHSLDGRRKVWYPDMRKRKRLAPSGCCAVCHPG